MEQSREFICNLVVDEFQLVHNFQTAFNNISRAEGRQVMTTEFLVKLSRLPMGQKKVSARRLSNHFTQFMSLPVV
ncbi:hypothetical protein KIN20_020147 [Parelaphostrongylus tenuis]|uniref:Uncharacterized protein n=1 Tax=Parelaphostrongylus tenuis TaxID=148309 RepID=A0AAD5MM59_PARTN|nr:hypothetical protein KIN20_020147 [Parelaphostrongylus tenuis]